MQVTTRTARLCVFAPALVACGTVGHGAVPGGTPNESAAGGSDGSASAEGSVTVPGGPSLSDAAAEIADGFAPDVSSTAPPDVAATLETLLPDGQCPAKLGSVISVTLDGKDLGGLPWTLSMGGTPSVVSSNGSAVLNDEGIAFYVTISDTGLTVGTWNAAAIGTTIQFADQPTFTCSGASVTGGVRITSMTKQVGQYAGVLVCGAYDLDCIDPQSGHHLHVTCTFEDSVPVPGPGGGN
jgi:hypothetical protein